MPPLITSDPIGFQGDAGNLYRYCHNDPEDKSDPEGLYETPLGGWDVIGSGKPASYEIDAYHGRTPTGLVMAQVRSDAGTAGQDDSATKGTHVVPTRLSRNGKTAYPTVSDHTGGHYEYQVRKDGKRVSGRGYSVFERLTLDPSVPHNKLPKIKQEKWRALQSNGIFPDDVGLGFRPSGKTSIVSVVFQTFDLKYNNQTVSVPTVLKHDVRYDPDAGLRYSVTVVTP